MEANNWTKDNTGIYLQSGIRTPKAEEIERITVDLKKYGQIEGKNVFYWFQNFNAKERNQRKSRRAEERQQPKRTSELLHPKSGGGMWYNLYV